MLSAQTRKRLRHVTLAGIGLSFLLLYLGPITIGSGALTTAALLVTAVVCVLAVLAF